MQPCVSECWAFTAWDFSIFVAHPGLLFCRQSHGNTCIQFSTAGFSLCPFCFCLCILQHFLYLCDVRQRERSNHTSFFNQDFVPSLPFFLFSSFAELWVPEAQSTSCNHCSAEALNFSEVTPAVTGSAHDRCSRRGWISNQEAWSMVGVLPNRKSGVCGTIALCWKLWKVL